MHIMQIMHMADIGQVNGRCSACRMQWLWVKPKFHDTDIDILARILTDLFNTSNFLKLFLLQAERESCPTRRHPRNDPREDVSEKSVSESWNVAFIKHNDARRRSEDTTFNC